MLGGKKITESVTGPSSISVPLPSTIQPSSKGQAQQNNTLSLISSQEATQPSSTGQPHQNDFSPPIGPQQAPEPTNPEQVQQDAPVPPITPQQVPHLSSLEQVSPSISIPTAPNITYPGEQSPSITVGTTNRNLKALRVPKFDGNKGTLKSSGAFLRDLLINHLNQ